MSNTTPSRLGQVNKSGAVDELFLKLFAGEILTEFARVNVFKDKHFVVPISGGKSFTFPLVGTVVSKYHTPGTFIDTDTVGHAEKVIALDQKLVSAIFLADIDEAMNHFEVRSKYSAEIGEELARAYDTNVSRVMTQAARASNPLTGRAGGSSITNASIGTDAALLEASFYTAAQTFDEKNVPDQGRSGFFRPAQYYLLAQRDRLINKELGGVADIRSGKISTVAGIDIQKTNNLVQADDRANTAIPARYRADYSTVRGVFSHPMAAGTVELMSMGLTSEYEARRQGTFMIASYVVGHDWLRPECAIEVRTAAPAA